MAPFRRGYIDGLKGNVQRADFRGRRLHKYNSGYAKGLLAKYTRLMTTETERKATS